MIKLLEYNEPLDIVISTGKAHSVKDLCKEVFSKLGMDYTEHIKVDPKFLRPQELPYLQGDSTKAKQILGWKPEFTFETLVEDMIKHFEASYK